MGCGEQKAAGPVAPPVEVVEVVVKDVPIVREWVGATDGLVNAKINAQVQGYLTKQNFQEGSFVKKGQVLFEIDFHAAVLFYGCTGERQSDPGSPASPDALCQCFHQRGAARRLGLKEGDLVEVWMEEHPDEKQQAFLSVSKVIHQDVLFSYHGLGKGLQKTTEKLQYAKKNGLTSTISVGSGFPRGLRALGVANADVFAWQGGAR